MDREVKDAIRFLSTAKSFSRDDFPSLRNALHRLLVMGSAEKDITEAMGYIVKVLPIEDIVTKKLACLLLTRFGVNVPGVSLLMQNTLRRDFHDPNPTVRCLALKTICSCSIQSEDAREFVSLALGDSSPYVRRSAVLGCAALFRKDCDASFVDRLYEMLRDPDPLVVSNALAALDEILEDEGGVVVNRNIAHHLLGRLTNFTEWGLARVLTFLGKYRPRSEEEIFDVLNVLDPLFESQNCGVVVQVAKLFLGLLEGMPDLRGSVIARICPRLAVFLNDSANVELAYLILVFVHGNLANNEAEFGPLYRSLFCKYRDPACIKVKKIEILTKLSSAENSAEVLDEIGMHCTDGCSAVSHAAISAIGQIARKHPGSLEDFSGKLFQLLALEQPDITSEVLFVLQNLDLGSLADKREFSDTLNRCYGVLEHTEGKCALLWLLGEHGQFLPESPELLERFLDDWPKCEDPEVRLCILSAAVKLFFKRPHECQMNLGRLLQMSARDPREELRDQARFYYTLLAKDSDLLQRIVRGTSEDEQGESHAA